MACLISLHIASKAARRTKQGKITKLHIVAHSGIRTHARQSSLRVHRLIHVPRFRLLLSPCMPLNVNVVWSINTFVLLEHVCYQHSLHYIIMHFRHHNICIVKNSHKISTLINLQNNTDVISLIYGNAYHVDQIHVQVRQVFDRSYYIKAYNGP